MEMTKKSTPNQYELHSDIKAILLHATLGAYKGAIEWLTSPLSNSSAHAVFGRLGQITELAEADKGTWHAGAIYKPSLRAKAILPKNLWGTLKNPNRSTIGLEFACGYDIDKDGIIESWEKLYSVKQIKSCAWYILNILEPKTGKIFGEKNILIHKDTASYKPDLEIPRLMVLAELKKQRELKENPKPETPVKVEPEKEIIITIKEDGETRKFVCKPI